jgi:hypothetical protein
VKGNFYFDVLRWLRENVQLSGITILGPAPWQHAPTRHSLCGSFWLQQKRQSSPTSLLTRPRPCDFFLFPKMKFKLKVRCFWEHWGHLGLITGCDEDADAKWLTTMLLIMEIPLGSLY